MRNIDYNAGGVTRVLLLTVLMGLIFTSCATTHTASQSQDGKQTHSRSLFDIHQARKNLVGKPSQEVVRTIGSPDREAGGGRWEWWTYESRFHDPTTQRTIREVTLVFQNGTLVDITY